MRRWLSGAGLMTALCLSALTIPGTASAATSPFTEAQAKEQLRDVERVEAGISRTDPTIALRDLALALPALDGAARRQARSILSRPPDGDSPYGGNWPNNAVEKFVETPAFVVHYVEVPGCDAAPPNPDANCDEPDLADDDMNDIPDYVDATVDAVDESIAVENAELGWPLPKGDGDEGEPDGSGDDDRFDVYISDLCDESDFNPCVFGFADPDDNSAELQLGAVQVQRPSRGRQRLRRVRRVRRRAWPEGHDGP